MSIGILAFSQRGVDLGNKIASFLPGASVDRCEKGGLNRWTETHFPQNDLIVFISSCGIAVRAISPFVVSKTSDPAVVVVDETGKYVISLLSGHLGGANAWTAKIADELKAEPVITTATDRNGLFAVDSWAKEHDLTVKNTDKIVDISSALVNGKTVEVSSDFPIVGKLPQGVIPGDDGFVISVYRSERLCLVPKVLTLGVGCKKGISFEKMEIAFQRMLEISRIYPESIKKIVSIDIKKDEEAIHLLSRKIDVPMEFYPAETLQKAPGEFTASKFVASIVGVDNVCERSAVVGSNNGTIILKKQALDGITMALAVESFDISF